MRSEADRRLHPFSIVRDLDPRAIGQAVPVLAFLAVRFDGAVAVAAVAIAVVGLLGVRVALWQRHTYRLTGEALVERRGLLHRRERTIHLDRLQQVEVDRSLLDRLVGTAVVRLETASDANEAELQLRVVDDREAERLRHLLVPRAGNDRDDPAGRELVHVPLSHVALASVTGRRLLAVPVVVGAALGILADLDLFAEAEQVATDAVTALGVAAGAAVVVAVLVGSAVAALVAGLLRDGDFRLREVGDDLHVRRGLIATRSAVVPRGRLQKVTIAHGWLRGRLGFASVTLHSAGGGGEGHEERQLTVPLVPAADAVPLLRAVLPGLGPLPPVHPHPSAARRRARLRYALAWLPFVVAAATVAGVGTGHVRPALGTAAVLAVAAAASGWYLGGRDHANRRSGLDDRWVVARAGALAVTEAVAPRDKVQGTTVATTPLQRRRGLATLVVHVAGPGGSVRMVDLAGDEAAARRRRLDDRWREPAASGPTAAR